MAGQKEVLWNTGENVGETDLNNMQRFLRATMTDWMLSQAGAFQGLNELSSVPSLDRSKHLFCLGDSGAPYPDGSTALKTFSLPGPIVQWTNSSALPLWGPGFGLGGGTLPTNWGEDVSSLLYWASPNELGTTHAVGDPTNPRWDLVCIRLNDESADVADQETRLQKQEVSGDFVISSDTFIKRRKVSLTKQVIQGTPAGSPTIPAVPSGFRPYYAVKIPATFNAVIPVDNDFHDYRMPLGSFSIDVPAWSATENGSGPAATTVAGALRPMRLGASSTFDFIPNITNPSSCRLIGVNALEANISGPDVVFSLGRYTHTSGGTYAQMGGNSTWTMNNLGGGTATLTGANLQWETEPFQPNLDFAPDATVKPPWGTGLPSGFAAALTGFVGVRATTVSANSLDIALVRLYFAGMPY